MHRSSRLKGRGLGFPLSSGVVEMEMEERGENGAVQAKNGAEPHGLYLHIQRFRNSG